MVFLWSSWLHLFYYQTFSSLIKNEIFFVVLHTLLLWSRRLSQSSLECWLKNVCLKQLNMYIWGIGHVQFAVNAGVVFFFLSVKNICAVINYWKLQSSLLFTYLNTQVQNHIPVPLYLGYWYLKEKINMTVPVCQ